MHDDQYADIIERLDALADTVGDVKVLAEKTNGRVTTLEAWQGRHMEEHTDLAPIADMAKTINSVRRFILYGLPFLTAVSALGGVVTMVMALL